MACFFGDDRQHMDNYMLVEHVKPTLQQQAVLQRNSGWTCARRFSRSHRCSQRGAENRMPSRPIATCCCPILHKSTRNRNWRFTPMTSSARMARPSGKLMRTLASTCAPVASMNRRRAASCYLHLQGECLGRIKVRPHTQAHRADGLSIFADGNKTSHGW